MGFAAAEEAIKLSVRPACVTGHHFAQRPDLFFLTCLPSTVLTTPFDSETEPVLGVCVATVETAVALAGVDVPAADWLAYWLKLSASGTKSLPLTLPS